MCRTQSCLAEARVSSCGNYISQVGLYRTSNLVFSGLLFRISSAPLGLRMFRNTPTTLNQAQYRSMTTEAPWALHPQKFLQVTVTVHCRSNVIQTLTFDDFMPCAAQLSAFLRQGRSLACVRSRPSFLSIRTTIKEALCFILEPHNWHLHIGSWNRGSSQRSQGIWQSEQFSHREQGFLLCTPPCSFWHCEITILLEARGEVRKPAGLG